MASPPVTLTVDGRIYSVWTSVRVTRGLKRGCSDFVLETPGEYIPDILPFMACTVSHDGMPVLTGYVDDVDPDIDAKSSRTVITGRSKVMDLVDCMPDFATNQFNGNTLDAIARAVAQAFGIDVVVGPGVDIGAAFPDATFERSEKAFVFLNRLAKQRGILLTDNARGNLVLATLGTSQAPAPLLMGRGGNVFRARGKLSGKQRYSQYTVRSQAGKKATGGAVQNAVKAIAHDGAVPRYRPWAGAAESASLADGAQLRADWEAAHRAGEAVNATLSVPEWDVNGTLWDQNQLVACNVPRLALEDTFLIGELSYMDDEREGRRAELTVAPPSAYTPNPTEKKGKGKGGKSGSGWQGLVPVA